MNRALTAPTHQAGADADDPTAVRVLIVDDSVVVRHIVSDVLRSESGLVLAGTASNGRQGIDCVDEVQPHVVVLDVEMPELDGREALVEIRKRWPKLPVIMFSTLTERGAAATFDALARGANDYVTKPSMAGSRENAAADVRANLVPLVRAWGDIARRRAAAQVARTQAKPAPRDPRPAAPGARPVAAPERERPTVARRTGPRTSVSAVVLGVSTGGPTALSDLIPLIPGNLRVPILAVQHMPPTFTKQLATRLDERSALKVVEAEPGMIPKPGHMYVAPGGMHMVVATTASGVSIALDDGPPENSCKPAVDTLFRSAVKAWGGRLLGVILTGMGQDGLAGCRTLTEAGGTVIVQDESSSVVWGMPGAVARAGLASDELPLSEISGAIVQRCGFGGAGR